MDRFAQLQGLAAPLPDENVDTDIIFPARFLLITARHGLGRYLFHDRRFDAGGGEQPGFVLNRPPWHEASILVAGANFGCGSSREQAVWALLGFGIRCVIAPSFGEIFHANCFRNGVLPIVLPADQVAALSASAAAGRTFAIDLDRSQLRVGDEPAVRFAVAPDQRLALLNGWDDTDLILNARGDDILAFEAKHRHAQPWLFERETAE